MNAVYDAGVLIAADANDRRTWADHTALLEARIEPLTTAPVVSQVSRSPRQVQLRRLLHGYRVLPFAREEAHRVGAILADTGSSHAVDAHVALTASDARASVWTSDPSDIRRLVQHTSLSALRHTLRTVTG